MKTLFLILSLLVVCVTPTLANQVEPTAPTPKLEIITLTVDDSVSGNNNGILEPGETATLQIFVFNSGTATAFNVYASLDRVEPGVTINTTYANLGDINPNSSKYASGWKITVSNSFPCGKDLTLYYTLSGDNDWTTGTYTLPLRELTDYNDGRTGVKTVSSVIYGKEAYDGMGDSLASGNILAAGNDDSDLVIGVKGGDGPTNARTDAGEVWIVEGVNTGTVDLNSSSGGSNLYTIYGANSNDLLGYSVAVGDINGDGYDDIVAGAPFASGSGLTGNGAVWVIFSNGPNFTDIDLSTPPTNTMVIYGASAGDQLGESVAVGDVNNDGYDDIIMGSINGAGPGDSRSTAGEVWIYYGHYGTFPSTVNLNASPANVTVIYGADTEDNLGGALTSGDVNGDGYEDIIIGAKYSDGFQNQGVMNGEVWIVYGSSALATSIDLATSPAGTTVIYGRNSYDNLGKSVATGDVNGDGIADLLLGADDSGGSGNNTGLSIGESWLVLGRSTFPASINLASPPQDAYVLYGRDDGGMLGGAVHIGDLDADGRDDVVITAPLANGPNGTPATTGQTWIFYSLDNFSHIDLWWDWAEPFNSRVIYGEDSNDNLGNAVTSGDFNRDGIRDLAVSAKLANGPNNGRTEAGEVLILYGRPIFDYRMKTDSSAYIDATSGTQLPLNCDNCCTSVTLPFSFEYFGRTYSTVYVCDDGYLSFSPVAYPNRISDCMGGNNIKPDNVVAVYWKDLDPSSGGGVYMLAQGTSPNRRVTFEWSNVPEFGNSTNTATFGVTFFESSNQILMQYQSTSGSAPVIGIENVNGRLYKSYSCNTGVPSSGERFIPIGTYRIFSEDFSSVGSWTTTGLWHIEGTNCQPAYHSATSSMYYGQTTTCNYDTGGSNSGTLTSPSISADYYSELSYWFRLNNEVFDVPDISISQNGGPFNSLNVSYYSTGTEWNRYTHDISDNSGTSIQLQYSFTADAINNAFLGWMVDDIEIFGCDVYGTNPIIQSLAYARPTPVCDSDSYILDGVGTYVENCSSVAYQWYENGLPIAGATTLQYTVPPGHATGIFSYFLRTTCTSTNDYDDSSTTNVQVVPMPGSVPKFKLSKTSNGSQIHMIWNNVSGGDEYRIYSDLVPSGSFSTMETIGYDGTVGVDIAMPTETKVFYLVAGWNSTCGVGTKK